MLKWAAFRQTSRAARPTFGAAGPLIAPATTATTTGDQINRQSPHLHINQLCPSALRTLERLLRVPSLDANISPLSASKAEPAGRRAHWSGAQQHLQQTSALNSHHQHHLKPAAASYDLSMVSTKPVGTAPIVLAEPERGDTCCAKLMTRRSSINESDHNDRLASLIFRSKPLLPRLRLDGSPLGHCCRSPAL